MNLARLSTALVWKSALLIAMLASRAAAQQPADTAYRSMQERGKMTMGVDQMTSSHGFEELPDGGRIVLVRTVADTTGVLKIRAHIRELQRAFSAGDFSMPMSIHMQSVPGTKIMADRHALISYTASDVPNGAALRIRTSDPDALKAIHEFLAFQRREHHAGMTP